MSPLYPPYIGGIELFVSWLSASLAARGHRIQVLCSHSARHLPDDMEWDGIEVCRVPFLQGIMQRSPLLLLQAQKRMRDIVQAFKPDVVHLHVGGPMLHAYLNCPAFRGIPLVLTVHDLPTDADQFPTVRRVLRQADWITTNSRIRLADVIRFEPTTHDRAQCLHVSKPTTTRPETVERSPHPLIFMAGRQVAEKGFDLAIDAFAQVRRRHPGARLVLAGDGPMHHSLRQMIEARGLGEAARLPGAISAGELADCYGRAWLTLVPSRHSESFGLVALEAMQAGCAVVASRIGGLPEVIEDGVTGRLVAPDSVSALAQAAIELLEDPMRTFAMGQAGRDRARRLFDWEHCVHGYEQALTRVAQP